MVATYKLSVEDFYNLGQDGRFDDQRAELLDGELHLVTEQPPHATCIRLLREHLHTLMPDTIVDAGLPLRLGGLSDNQLPVPDVMVVDNKLYLDHSSPEDVKLLVEVSWSTYAKDAGRKSELYAQHGVAKYWIINLRERRIETHCSPVESSYQEKAAYGLYDSFKPATLNVAETQYLPEAYDVVLKRSL